MEPPSRTQLAIAVITVAGSVAVAIIGQWDKLVDRNATAPVSAGSGGPESTPPSGATGTRVPEVKKAGGELAETASWTLVAEDRFEDNAARWWLGEGSDERCRFDITLRDGVYRWSIGFKEVSVRWQDAPFGAAVESYAAVDIRFLQLNDKPASAGLAFGIVGDTRYSFRISSNGSFTVDRLQEKITELIAWTPLKLEPGISNRVAVRTTSSLLSFYVNGKLVSDLNVNGFGGGRVAFVAGGNAGTETVLAYDNFEFRRRPPAN